MISQDILKNLSQQAIKSITEIDGKFVTFTLQSMTVYDDLNQLYRNRNHYGRRFFINNKYPGILISKLEKQLVIKYNVYILNNMNVWRYEFIGMK